MKNERLNLAEWATKYAQKQGADEVKVDISNSRSVDVSFRDKKIENLTEATENSLSLTIYANHKYSSHSTSDLRKDALEKFIEEAVSATKYLSQDEFRTLPDPKYYPKDLDVDLDLVDKQYENVNPEKRKEIAKEIEEIARTQSDKIISASAGYSDGISESVKAHSNGFLAENKTTYFSCGASVTVKDESGGRPEDWYWGSSRFFNQLPDPQKLGTEAAKRALRKIGQSKIKSGKYDLVIENRSGGRLLGMMSSPMSARALQQKSSFLEGMLGKQIASEKLTLIDDPFVKGAFGSRLYDGEGIATRKKVVIEKGILRHYYVDTYYGKKLDMEPNCGSPTNILFEYGDKSAEDMIKEMKNGIFVTGFIGGNSNSTTGDFSFGIVGLLVEDGKITKPVNEINISGNAKEFWNSLVEVGNDPYPYSSWKIPAFKFAQADISGI
ncbi:MAG: TldD/PmbA family protein [Melioribacteraceae bacterium]|nr:TldD/PmbA family protein [Melioribacteraceae bacterium]